MRIIAGEYRGRKLSPIHGHSIRPTADRTRESIFNIIGTHTLDAVVLDLFAGTGALGLEALSRGAATVVFVDNNKKALSVVGKSISMLGVGNRAQVIQWDIAKSLDCLGANGQVSPNRRAAEKGKVESAGFDLVFIDPPYSRNLIGKALIHLSQRDILSKEAVLVVEHSLSEQIPKDEAGYRMVDQRVYGKTSVSFLRLAV